MPMYRTGIAFVEDFVNRTKENYEFMKNSPYSVTQLINSTIGILVVPKENEFVEISDNFIDNSLLKKMKNCVEINTYDKPLNLSQMIRHLRNGIAHNNMEFLAEQPPKNNEPLIIHNVTIKDKDDYNNFKFEITIPVDLLKEFFMNFAEAVIEYCKNHK